MPLHRSSTYTVVLYLYVWQPCIGATFPFYRAIKSASFSFLLTISCWGKLHVRVLNMAHYFLPHTFFSSMGSFKNYVDTILDFLDYVLKYLPWMHNGFLIYVDCRGCGNKIKFFIIMSNWYLVYDANLLSELSSNKFENVYITHFLDHFFWLLKYFLLILIIRLCLSLYWVFEINFLSVAHENPCC